MQCRKQYTLLIHWFTPKWTHQSNQQVVDQKWSWKFTFGYHVTYRYIPMPPNGINWWLLVHFTIVFWSSATVSLVSSWMGVRLFERWLELLLGGVCYLSHHIPECNRVRKCSGVCYLSHHTPELQQVEEMHYYDIVNFTSMDKVHVQSWLNLP